MENLAKDWLYIHAAAADLPDYLLSSELFLPLVVKGNSRWTSGWESLSLGNILLTQFRLRAVEWPAEQQKELDQLGEKIGALRTRWLSAWSKKAEQEAQLRIRLWGQFLNEWFEDRGKNASGYPYQVRQRVILDLLAGEMRLPNAAMEEQIKIMDRNLSTLIKPGEFIWGKELANGFQKDRFWYLYIVS